MSGSDVFHWFMRLFAIFLASGLILFDLRLLHARTWNAMDWFTALLSLVLAFVLLIVAV